MTFPNDMMLARRIREINEVILTETLMCPKCAAPLRSIERNGMTIERCMERGGIFLDRGELERLIQAEGEFNVRALQDDRFRDERW